MSYHIAKLSEINPSLVTDLRNRCYTIIGLCQQVHREMGPFSILSFSGFDKSRCFCLGEIEFLKGITVLVVRQAGCPAYKQNYD